MSYTPAFLINYEDLTNYNVENNEIFEWQYYPHEPDSAIKIISDIYPFSETYGSLVNIRGTYYAFIKIEFASERVSLVTFLGENEMEYYLVGG